MESILMFGISETMPLYLANKYEILPQSGISMMLIIQF